MVKFDSSLFQNATKNDVINAIIKEVYENPHPLKLTSKERKKIEKLYKIHYNNCKSFNDFRKKDPFIRDIFDDTSKKRSGKYIQSVRNYIEWQIEHNKALQPGILAECIFVEALASSLGCTAFYDANYPSSNIPAWILAKIDMLHLNCNDASSVRWYYYNKKDKEKLILQYGNPEDRDASIVIFVNEIILEIKDMPAVYADKDLYYDECGKLLVTPEIHNEYPVYEQMINDFNAKTSVFNELGGNWPLNLNGYLPMLLGHRHIDFDLLLTSKNDELVVLKALDLISFVNGEPVISVKGSEIRMIGKNSAKVFTPNAMNQIFAANGIHQQYGCWIADKTSVDGPVKGRGMSRITRIKLTPCFYLEYKDVTETDTHYLFDINKVRQSKCGISVHLNIAATASEIYDGLYRGVV